ncbi:MAG: DUF6125 family protein [Pseudomonadota bacterium]
MTKLTNLEEYRKLSKEQLIDLLQLFGRGALTIDGFWFLGVEKLHGTEEATDLDEQAWGHYGKVEAKLLKKYLSMEQVTRLEDICRIYLLTPIFGNLGATAEVRGNKCYLSVTDCHPQKARVREKLGEFPCKGVGIAYFKSFLSELNPSLKFGCVVCPPDEHPEDLWCEWEVWFEENPT